MALDEYLFGKIARYFKQKKKSESEKIKRTVLLSDISARLTILARAATGKPINIFSAEREGGYKGCSFFLPVQFSLFPISSMNLSFYFYRVLYLATQQKLNYNWHLPEEISTAKAQQKSLDTSSVVLNAMFIEYPITVQLHHEFLWHVEQPTNQTAPPDYSWLYGKWMRTTSENNSENTLENFSNNTKEANTGNIETVLKAQAVEEVIVVEVDKKQQEDFVLSHNFEKVETAEEHDGGWRDFDGADELEKHEEALDELNMKYVVRVDDTVHSIYQADFTENTKISESAGATSNEYHISYDEWNYAKNEYKKDYCNVYPRNIQKIDKVYYDKTIQENYSTLTGLRKMLTSINNKMQMQRRQTDGDEFELDAITDLFVDVHSGVTPSENIYISKRKKEKDISILLLLDVSLSSDGYADGNRVIDVEKQVSILFGEIMHEQQIDFAVQCFNSKTRNYCSYLSLKDFDDNWQQAKFNIGGAEPCGYTRMGPALRHAGALLKARDTKNKWVILLSDGKPNDYDKYEGKYGIQDVKQALRELKQNQINTYALAIEGEAKYYLPQMFGQNHYQVISTPKVLINSLVKLYEKIKY